jgi:hypothetical protein
MSIQHFLVAPKSYLKVHTMFLNNSDTAAGTMLPNAAVALPQGGHSVTFNRGGNITIVQGAQNVGPGNKLMKLGRRMGVVDALRRDVTITAGANAGLRYLPFRVNHVTVMSLDVNATFWLTGPLTGCTVAAGRDNNGVVWVFHSNWNNANGGAARTAQQNMITDAAAGMAGINLRYCVYTQHYDGMGFVFGRPRGHAWKFYAHWSPVGANPETRKWAEV